MTARGESGSVPEADRQPHVFGAGRDDREAAPTPDDGCRDRRDALHTALHRFGDPDPDRDGPALESLSGRWRSFTEEGLRAPPDPFALTEASTAPTEKRLAGLQVLDLSWVWSGPAATTALSDLGANVRAGTACSGLCRGASGEREHGHGGDVIFTAGTGVANSPARVPPIANRARGPTAGRFDPSGMAIIATLARLSRRARG